MLGNVSESHSSGDGTLASEQQQAKRIGVSDRASSTDDPTSLGQQHSGAHVLVGGETGVDRQQAKVVGDLNDLPPPPTTA
jgi:hypothetical protein